MTEPAKKLYLLPEDLRTDLLAYLHSRPYAEVARGVQRLEALAEVPAAQPAPVLAAVPDVKE